MDDLDRLHARLLDAVRADAPHLRDRRFRLGDIPRYLLPYRLHRSALAFDSVEQYERALARLASGERGYLSADANVQQAFRRVADGAAPADEALRAQADAMVALAPETRHRPDATPPESRPAVREGPEADASPAGGDAIDAGGLVIPIAPVVAVDAADDADDPDDAPAPPPADAAMPFPTRPPAQRAGGACPHCGQALPEGRGVTFCPYCGENLTIRRCPACSTELDAAWRFCITCGREADAPAGANA